MSAPGVVIDCFCHTGAHRIEVNIAHKLEKVGIGIDEKGFVPPLEYMAGPLLGIVDPLRVSKGNILHDPGERYFPRLHYEMDVVCHQAECMYSASELFNRMLENQI